MVANEVANAMGTSDGSRALTIKQAILIAVIFRPWLITLPAGAGLAIIFLFTFKASLGS